MVAILQLASERCEPKYKLSIDDEEDIEVGVCSQSLRRN